MQKAKNDIFTKLSEYAFEYGLPNDVAELTLPNGLAWIEGNLKGNKVWMESKAWQHKDFRLIRYTRLFSENRISTFNWVIYPQDWYDAPIFASDFVIGGDKLRIAVIDAMPIFPNDELYKEKWISPFKALHEESTQIAPQFERKLSWSTKFLSQNACLATGINSNGLHSIITLWKKYMQLYWNLTAKLDKVNPSVENKVKQWHQQYNDEHKAVEDKRNPYLVYFGEELGKRYNREFLFSDIFGR